MTQETSESHRPPEERLLAGLVETPSQETEVHRFSNVEEKERKCTCQYVHIHNMYVYKLYYHVIYIYIYLHWILEFSFGRSLI